MRRLMSQAIKVTDKGDFWKNAMNIIGDLCAETKESTMRGCQKKIPPQMMNDLCGL